MAAAEPTRGAAAASPPAREATRALVLATVAFTVSFYAWSLLGPLGPDLQDRLGLSDVQTSAMISIPVVLGSLMRVPLGLLTARYGGRRVFTLLIAYTVLPLLALAAWHDDFAIVVALGFLLGFAGASFAVGVPFVSRWYPPGRQGAALGIYGMGMGGTVVAGLTAPGIADAWGIGAPFLVAAGLLAVTGVAFVALARDAPAPPGWRPPSWREGLDVFRADRRAWALTLFYFLAFGGFVAMFLYLPKLLTSVHELTRTDAGARAAGFALLAVLARPTGGWLADRVGAARVLRVSFAATVALALALAATYTAILPLTIACLSLAVVLGLGTGAVFKLVAEWFPAHVGAVTGVVGAAGGLGGFFPPLVMAAVNSATGGYAIGFVLLAAVGVACLAVLAATGDGGDAPRAAAAAGSQARSAPSGGS